MGLFNEKERLFFFCEKCGFVGSAERSPNNPPNCNVCGTKMICKNISIDEWQTKSPAQKEEIKNKWRLEAKEKSPLFDNIYQNMRQLILTTGYNLEGYKITKYISVISGSVVLGTGFLSEFSASISDLFGEKSELFAEKLEMAKGAAQEKLKKSACKVEADGIIGIDFDYITFSGNMVGVAATGTAVKLEKITLTAENNGR
ncbi:YbjQ family protein [Diplocloster hominis]|uniref:YbjQ family protein n=1 Tax=Diplocloster hominis TaxID=3079010 RepID=UPI0031BAE59E